jgi:hypothetical protein
MNELKFIMILIFLTVGNITQPNGPPLENANSKIYLMDIRNYTWVYTFEPSSNPSTTSASNNPFVQPSTNGKVPEFNNQLTTMKVVIAAMGGIFGTVILMTIGFLGYRWHKRRQREGQDRVFKVYGNHGSA